MGVESYLVLWVFTDECCHPNRFRVELMLIESFEIGRLDFPNRDTLEFTHCFLPNARVQAARAASDYQRERNPALAQPLPDRERSYKKSLPRRRALWMAADCMW